MRTLDGAKVIDSPVARDGQQPRAQRSLARLQA